MGIKPESEMKLSAPVKYSPRVTRWSAEKILQDEKEQGIDLPAPQKAALSAEDLAERYGVTRVTIWRWTRKPSTKGRAVA